jgi:predicted amidohydrolase
VQEKFYFNPGDTGFKVFNTKFCKLGVAICWDQWFPECARAMVLQVLPVAMSIYHTWPSAGTSGLSGYRESNQV